MSITRLLGYSGATLVAVWADLFHKHAHMMLCVCWSKQRSKANNSSCETTHETHTASGPTARGKALAGWPLLCGWQQYLKKAWRQAVMCMQLSYVCQGGCCEHVQPSANRLRCMRVLACASKHCGWHLQQQTSRDDMLSCGIGSNKQAWQKLCWC